MGKKPPYSDLSFYDDNLGLYKRLKEEVLFSIDGALDFRVHSVVGRVKERKSVFDKILRKSYVSPEKQLEDIVGVRVICLYRADLERVDAAIRSIFDVITYEDKTAAGPDDQFGYMSVHYICTLGDSNSGPRYDPLQGLKFELQVRTILMDAWANISHHLAYKGENSLPLDKRKGFNALAGLFYVADDQFEQLATAAVRATPPGDDALLDRDTTLELLKEMLPDRDDDLLTPEGEPRISHVDVQRFTSDFVEEVTEVGYETVGQLRADLEAYNPAALQWEKENPAPGLPDAKYFRVGIARRALSIGNDKFRTLQYERTYG